MEPIFVGIDVAKDRLDVHRRPSGEAFAARLRVAGASLVVLDATGGSDPWLPDR